MKYLLSILCLITTLIFTQPEIEWSQTFGGWSADFAHSVEQTADGGYIIGGYTRSSGNGNSDVWLIKTDSNGQEQWNRTFGGSSNDTGRFVQQTLDGGYIIAGRTESFGNGGSDVWLIKTDPNGFEEWNQTFGGTSTDFGWSVQQTLDGGYIMVGTTFSFGNGSYDAWLIKTNANGQEEWNQTFGGSDYEYGHSVEQTLDGGYILAGNTVSFGNDGSSDVWLVKTNANGQEEWNRTFGGTGNDIGYSVQQTLDAGYIIVGDTGSFGNGLFDVWLVKTDSNGFEEWNQTFGGGNYEQGSSVQQTLDGGYIITGRTESFSDGVFSALWLIKTDPDGEEEWNQTFGEENNDNRGQSVQQAINGGYIIAGYTQSYGNAGSVDVLLIKTECENIINENCDCGADFFMCHDGSIVCDESDCVDIPDNYPNWVDSPGQYEYTAYVNGVIYYDDEQMADEGDLFAAFDEDGNIRGLGTALFVPFGPYENSTLWEITLRSNEEIGDVLSFQYYDASHDVILDILETYTFVADELSGSLVDPLEFTAVFPEENEDIVGDLNGDGLINIVDIVSLLNIILYIGEYSSIGDVNEDGTLNVVDILIMVNWILGSTSE